MGNSLTLVVLTTPKECRQIQKRRFEGSSRIVVACFSPGLNVTEEELKKCKSLKSRFVRLISYEELQKTTSKFTVTKEAINVVSSFFDNFLCSPIVAKHKEVIDVLDTQRNMVSLALHDYVGFYLALDNLLKQHQFTNVQLLSPKHKWLRLPERPDISFLLFREPIFTYLAASVCKRNYVKSSYRNCWYSDAAIKFASIFRSKLLTVFKFFVTLIRAASNHPTKPKCKYHHHARSRHKTILIIVRAASELWSIKPVLSELQKRKKNKYHILQDDLIKNPSAKKELERQSEDFIPIHLHTSIFQVLMTWCRGGYSAASLLNSTRRHNFEGTSSSALVIDFYPLFQGILYNALRPLPELYLFRMELEAWTKKLNAGSIVTMDMVDQWCGVVGLVGKNSSLPTFTLQNTAIEKIAYPTPSSTDFFWVANVPTKKLLDRSLSSEEQSKVFVTGLPMHDYIFDVAANRKNSLIAAHNRCKLAIDNSEKIILVATQPFVESLPYSKLLIEDTLYSVKKTSASRVIVKIHPRESVAEYVKIVEYFAQIGNKIDLVTDGDIVEYLKVADVFISRTSTALETAVVANVPTIAYLNKYPTSMIKNISYLSSPAVKKCLTRECLATEISAYLNSVDQQLDFEKNRKKFLAKEFEGYSGCAAKAVTDDLLIRSAVASKFDGPNEIR